MKRPASFLNSALPASVCAAWLVCSAAPAQAQQPQAPLTRNVREAVTARRAPFLKQLDPAKMLKLSIALPLRNEAALDSLLAELENPASRRYHQWLSVAEFTDRFGPSAADYEAVVRYVEANGMTLRARTANRFLVDVDASAAQVNKAFHVTMGTYRHPTENRSFYAPDRQPSLDLAVKIWHIEGLDDYAVPRPMLRTKTNTTTQGETTGSAPGGQFLGSDFRAAYYGSGPLNGAGQSIGLYGLGYNLSDVQRYYNNVGQPFNPAVVQNYSTDGTGNSCGSGCDDGEPVIDIVSSLSMAPGVKAVIEYFGSTSMDVFNAMATANVAKQLSASIAYSPADPATEDPIFKEFAAQGQTLFAASGDSGAWDGSQVFEFPADDPYVTAVGGTDLNTNGAGGSWQTETAWVGSSGGVNDQNVAIPNFQQMAGVITAANRGSKSLRNVPDVAAEGNTDNWFCANGNPCQGGLGGTSFAAPRWAGFLALANQQAANNGRAPVGALNPIVYSIGLSSSAGADFHDITTGNNNNSSAGYNAVSGYDLVTGWGSPNGQAMINTLAPPSTAKLSGAHVVAPASSPGLVLDDYHASTASKNEIDIYAANGTGAQSWVFSSNGVQPAGAYNIAVSLGRYCMTATGSGSAVNLQACNGSSAQAWSAAPSGGRYLFHPASDSSLCLDVRSAGTSSGTLVQAYPCNGTNAQKWALQ